MKLLHKSIRDGSYVLNLRARDLPFVFHQALNHLIARGILPEERRDEIEESLERREREASSERS